MNKKGEKGEKEEKNKKALKLSLEIYCYIIINGFQQIVPILPYFSPWNTQKGGKRNASGRFSSDSVTVLLL